MEYLRARAEHTTLAAVDEHVLAVLDHVVREKVNAIIDDRVARMFITRGLVPRGEMSALADVQDRVAVMLEDSVLDRAIVDLVDTRLAELLGGLLSGAADSNEVHAAESFRRAPSPLGPDPRLHQNIHGRPYPNLGREGLGQ